MALALIPQPHRLTLGKGSFQLSSRGTLGISDSSLFPAAREAQAFLERFDIGVARKGDAVTIALRDALKPGGYLLSITAVGGVRIQADSPPAAAHAVQTLAQIVRQCPGGRLPALRIDDWPDLPNRGVYYDVCRGRVPRLERLIELTNLLAGHKINHLQLYIEHTFRFRGHPNIGKNASPLTAEDIMSLDTHCRARGIELVPSLASFGHLATVLHLREYRHLAEDWGIGEYIERDGPHWGMRAWSLSPANPKIYGFLDSLFAEFLPCFSSDQFNVCCDETWDLGWGQSHELCKKRGKGRVYLDHIVRLNELCRKYGKRMMFWGDIVRTHPELIAEIPRDVTVLDWGYAHNRDFASIRDFKESGLSFYGCPGTSSWVSLFPRLPVSRANIHGFAAAAKEHGAVGVLNTDWGDGGHHNFMEYSWYGFLFGAEQSWNTGADRASFTSRFARLFLRTDSRDVVRAIETLGDVTTLSLDSHYQSIWFHALFAAPEDGLFTDPAGKGWVSMRGEMVHKKVAFDARLARNTIEKLKKVRTSFAACRRDRGADPQKLLDYWLFAVDSLLCAAGKLAAFGKGGTDTPATRARLKRHMKVLQARFEKLWMARNRRSEIRITLARYRKAIRDL